MNKRTMDEMISYFNQEVSKMDIPQENKIKLLGMITAIGFESKKQEVVHGEWIHGREIGKEWKCGYWTTYYEDWHCSNCGVVFEQESKPKYHFCPNCGAKMDGGEP